MQENHLFEYAVIRIVPRVEREEFLNVGVVLYCSGQKFLSAKFDLDEERLSVFCKNLEMPEVRQNLNVFLRICAGDKDAGPIAKLDMASRFRWLTATRSTVMQCSKVHIGFAENASNALDKLFQQLVQ